MTIQNATDGGGNILNAKAHKGAVTGVSWIRPGQDFVSVGADGKVKIWKHDASKNSWTESISVKASDSPLTGLSVHPTGHYVVVSFENSWSFIDIRDGTSHLTQVIENAGKSIISVFAKGLIFLAITTCKIHPDGLLLGVGSDAGHVHVFDIKSNNLVHTFEGHPAGSPVNNIVFSENGYFLASSSEGENVVRIWDLRKLSNAHNIELSAPATSVNWDHYGQYLGVVSNGHVRYAF